MKDGWELSIGIAKFCLVCGLLVVILRINSSLQEYQLYMCHNYRSHIYCHQ